MFERCRASPKLLALTVLAASARANDADDVTLLQLGVGRLSAAQGVEGPVEDALKSLGSVTDPAQAELLVQELAQRATRGGATIDDETKGVLEGMKRAFEDTSEVSILAAHAEDEKLLQEHAEAVAACAVQYGADQVEDGGLGGIVSDNKDFHKDCHHELQGLDADRATHCDNLDNFRKGLTPPSCAVPGTNDAMHGYLTSMKSFGLSNLDNWERLHQLCLEATEKHAARHADCGTSQAQYEMSFCEWRVEVHESCYDYASCYGNALGAFEQTKDSALSSAGGRQLEWAAIQKIKCYVDILVSDEKRDQSQMDACGALEPDTSHLEISAPKLVEEELCDLSAVQDFPCTAAFLTNYEGMTNLRSCLPCTAMEPHLLFPGQLREPANPHAGEYEVWYQGSERSTGASVDCDGFIEQPDIFFDRLHTYSVREKCRQPRDAKATFVVYNTHGSEKYECLWAEGENLVGHHYTADQQHWGSIEYKHTSKRDCSAVSAKALSAVEQRQPKRHAGEYTVWYQGKQRPTGATVGCDGALEQPGIFTDELHTEGVVEKCRHPRDAQATFVVFETHGADKYECLWGDGDNLYGNHYTNDQQHWGTIVYRFVSHQDCKDEDSPLTKEK